MDTRTIDVFGNRLSTDCVTAEQAIAECGLNWEVALQPTYLAKPGAREVIPGNFPYYNPPTFHEIPDKKAAVRTDTGTYLGTVGSQFEPIQNRECFDFFNEIVARGEAEYYGGGTTRAGKDVWLLARSPQNLLIGGDPDEAVARYWMLKNGHDGGSQLSAFLHKQRIRCTNALNMTMAHAQDRISIRHTRSWRERMDEASEILRTSYHHDQEFEKIANKLITERLPGTPYVERFLNQLIPDPPENSGAGDRMIENRKQAREAVLTILRNGPDVQNINHTKYGLLNSVAEYADWGRRVKGNGENRFLRILTDTAIKTRALELLTV